MKTEKSARTVKQKAGQSNHVVPVKSLPPGVRPMVAAALERTLKKNDALFRALVKSGD